MVAFQKDAKRVVFPGAKECYDAFLHEETRTVDKSGCFALSGVIYEAGVVFRRKKIDVRFDPFDLSVVEVWHGGAKQLDAKPIIIPEFTNTQQTKSTPTEIGRSRLLDAYAKENEQRKKYAMGVLNFEAKEGENNV
jgi:hypothetical protein